MAERSASVVNLPGAAVASPCLFRPGTRVGSTGYPPGQQLPSEIAPWRHLNRSDLPPA
ncbi:MAG TPA: hypothetical protein G4N90_04515 [Dehalococcoidia bacterium]|nr:hypothetical protein [Dehalococcoidia bacterium]